MSNRRYESLPEFRQDEEEDERHPTGCLGCENRMPVITDRGYVICKIYMGKISGVSTGCGKHHCDKCLPSEIIKTMAQLPIVKIQKTLQEI